MENIGSSATIGSWEIIAISRPRTWLSSFSASPTSSRPCQRIEPPETETPSGNRPISERAVIVLPQPDSPTRPSTVPGRGENETPVTSAGPSSTDTDRSRTSRTADGSAGGGGAAGGGGGGGGGGRSVGRRRGDGAALAADRRLPPRGAPADGVGELVDRDNGEGQDEAGRDQHPRRVVD